MTKTEWYEIGALALGAAAIVLFMTRGTSAPVSQTADFTPPTPNYLTFNRNIPGASPPNSLASVGSNAGPSGAAQPTCSCGASSADLPAYSSVNDFAQTLNAQLDNLANDYSDAILAQVPDYVSQYFNNTQGIAADEQASTQFSSLGGLTFSNPSF